MGARKEMRKSQVKATKGLCSLRESNRDFVLNCGLQVCRLLIFGKRTKGQFRANGVAEGRLMEQNINAHGCSSAFEAFKANAVRSSRRPQHLL